MNNISHIDDYYASLKNQPESSKKMASFVQEQKSEQVANLLNQKESVEISVDDILFRIGGGPPWGGYHIYKYVYSNIYI